MRAAIRAVLAVMLVTGVSSMGCEEEENGQRFRPSNPDLMSPSIEARERIKQQGTGLLERGSDGAAATVALPKLSETDFIEGGKHRDPFRPFVEVLVRQEDMAEKVQREVKLKEYDVADLKLIAIVTNIGDERAMVVTPANEGIVLRRGDYVGRPEYVETGAGEKIQVNWRVARIHGSGKDEERGIYLVRDDPLTETPEDVTRFVPLHPAQ